jgi:hypothetical protein
MRSKVDTKSNTLSKISDNVSNIDDNHKSPPKSGGFHYIPTADGNSILGLDLSNFMKEKVFSII